jgi:DNA-binding NarL/FixJ family response regulator
MVLIDDNPSMRTGVVAGIRAHRTFQVRSAPPQAAAALRKVRKTKPDLVLLSLRRKGDHGLSLARALHIQISASRVILVGLEPVHKDVMSFVRAGVSGFIMERASFDTFLSTLCSVARGTQVLPPELTHSLFVQLYGRGARN